MVKSHLLLTCLPLILIQHPAAQTSIAAYTLVPQTAVANQAFTLTLKSPRFSCATRYSSQTVNRAGNTLNLGFKAVNDTGIHCAKSDSLFGPSFSIPPLITGSDSVYAIQQPACAPLCAIAVRREFAGILNVINSNDSGWFIQPKQTAADKSFILRLLNYAYSSCQTTFTHTSLDTGNHSLYASFVVENHPESACAADIRPDGPSYDVPALPFGKYPVYAVQHLSCEYTVPECLVAIRPILVDTLSVVLTPTSVFPRAPYIFQLSAPVNPSNLVQGYTIDGRKFIPRQ